VSDQEGEDRSREEGSAPAATGGIGNGIHLSRVKEQSFLVAFRFATEFDCI
jgi:hypothetical protein